MYVMKTSWRDFVKIANGPSGADAATVGASALGGSALGAIIGYVITKNRAKKIRNALIGQIIGGISGSAIGAYGPILMP